MAVVKAKMKIQIKTRLLKSCFAFSFFLANFLSSSSFVATVYLLLNFFRKVVDFVFDALGDLINFGLRLLL